jgi:hypothetical protein
MDYVKTPYLFGIVVHNYPVTKPPVALRAAYLNFRGFGGHL